jgi:pseudouridine kinase
MSHPPIRIACIGGIDIDHKARVLQPARLGTSNPVTVSSCTGGVAGNAARSLAHLGCEVSLFSIVGRDAAGDAIESELGRLGIATASLVRSVAQPTASYTAVLEADGQLFIGLANMEIFEELTPEWADAMAPQLDSHATWVVDANLPRATIERLLRGHKKDNIVVADPVSVTKAAKFRELLPYVDVIFPNRKEAEVLSGLRAGTHSEIEAAAREIRRQGAKGVVLTLGEEGIYVDNGKMRELVPPIPPHQVRDVTGAGDALVAGYTYGLALKSDNTLWMALAAASLTLETGESVSRELTPEKLAERIESYKGRKASR